MKENECLKIILTRRSVRRFTPKPVSQEEAQTLLKAAMAAPSAMNQQPWHFVAISERRTLDAIPSIHPHSQMLREAPMGILVCGEMSSAKSPGYWTQDCSAATQNLLLAAHALSLGAVWLGVYPDENRIAGLRRLLALPENVVPFAMIAIGHPRETPPPADRFSETRIHRERW